MDLLNQLGKRVSTWLASNGSLSEALICWDGQPVDFRAGGATHFQHQNVLGSESYGTTVSGTTESQFSALAFRDGYQSNGSDYDWYHFAGLDFDPESTTQHATFRQYSTTQGHWMSPDPYDGSYDFSNPQSLNRYSYALNNPFMYRDPSGLFCEYLSSDNSDMVEETDFNSSSGECATNGGVWTNDAWGYEGTVETSDGSLSSSLPYANTPSYPGTGVSGGGGSSSNTSSDTGKSNCPALPPHPDVANVNSDVSALQGGWNNVDAIQLYNFKQMVQTGGPYDYKQWGDYAYYGNFNYGYVGAALGVPDELLRLGAGYANWHDNPQNRGLYGSPSIRSIQPTEIKP